MGTTIVFDSLDAMEELAKGLRGVDFSPLQPNKELLHEAQLAIDGLEKRIESVETACRELERKLDKAEDADERDKIRGQIDGLRSSSRQLYNEIASLSGASHTYESNMSSLKSRCESLRSEGCATLERAVEKIREGAGLMGTPAIRMGETPSSGIIQEASSDGTPLQLSLVSPLTSALNHPGGLGNAALETAGVSSPAVSSKMSDVDKLRVGGVIQGYADQIASMSLQELDLVRASLGITPHMPKTGGTWIDTSGNPCDGPDATFSGTWSPDRTSVPSQSNPDSLTWGQIEQQYGPIDIRFQDGHPVFSGDLVKGEFKLGKVTGDRSVNYGQMYKQMLDSSSGKSCLSPDLAARAVAFMQDRGCDWFQTQSDVKEFLKAEGLTPHDCHNGTMQLIPSIIHGNIPHSDLISAEGTRDDIIKKLSDVAQKHDIILDAMIGDRILPLGKGGILASSDDPSKAIARCVGDGRGNIGLTNLCPGSWKVMREGTPHIIEVPTNKVLGVAMAGEPVPKVHIMLPDSKIVSIVSFPGQISLGAKS